MMKKALLYSILLVCALFGSTCKKISRNPFNMYGLWVSNEGMCGCMAIEIKRDGKGSYGTWSQDDGCDGKDWNGKVKYTENALYIGIVKLKYLQKPEVCTSNDSIDWYLAHPNRQRILARMKVHTSFLQENATYTFNKIVNY